MKQWLVKLVAVVKRYKSFDLMICWVMLTAVSSKLINLSIFAFVYLIRNNVLYYGKWGVFWNMLVWTFNPIGTASCTFVPLKENLNYFYAYLLFFFPNTLSIFLKIFCTIIFTNNMEVVMQWRLVTFFHGRAQYIRNTK